MKVRIKKLNPAALERVKVSAYMLTHALRDWEAAR